MMKTVLEPDLKSKTYCIGKSYCRLEEKGVNSINIKLYQKLIVFFISFLTILIFPESSRELENICMIYNSKKICNVW